MKNNIIVSPSILNADFSKLKEECVSLQNCGADWIHCDVMDGIFVPNTAFGVADVEKINRFVNVPLDVHLMVENPDAVVEKYIAAGADIVTFHIEAAQDALKTAQCIKNCGVKVGMSVKPATDVRVLLPFANLLDMVLIMTVEPGFGGQKFIPQCLEKIKLARQLFPNVLVEVDGGINDETAKQAVKAGANVLVAGSYIIYSENRTESIEKLKNV